MSTPSGNDNRRVALIKSLATNNRFYALVTLESGIRNADTVENIPNDLHLGIAYPCLEDGLNDFAIIRTTYETLEYYPDDDVMRKELMDMINDSRLKLVRRLSELQERIAAKRAHFLGTDLNEFKAYALDIVHRGYPRRNLDNMMKLNVFGSVAKEEGHEDGSEPLYRYEFRKADQVTALSQQPARQFIASLFGDVLDSVTDDSNYSRKYLFDRNVFQKFIALMFVNYATTDPMFYGTNRLDYGVSEEKDMEETPLYKAVAREMREIEIEVATEDGTYVEPVSVAPADLASAHLDVSLLGALVNEDGLIGNIASICAAAEQISKRGDHEVSELSRIILNEASKLVAELKRLNIISPFAYDPGSSITGPDDITK
ncbi:MAG: hypothetical protein ABJA67_01610 [Chthonomonadales bacterium]